MYNEDNLLPLSALQHLLFCERQCALIHVEQQWDENRYTAEGRIMHERVDSGRPETRKDVRLEFGLPLRSLRLGLIGKADVVEFHRIGEATAGEKTSARENQRGQVSTFNKSQWMDYGLASTERQL